MRSIRRRAVCFFAALLFAMGSGYAAGEEPWTDQFLRSFSQIKDRLATLEKDQDALIKREDQALAEIDQIRKWVAKRPGKRYVKP